MLSNIKKLNMDQFSNALKGGPPCDGCSVRLNVFRRKKTCFFCKNSFCQLCIFRRPDKKFCCRKCQILTARPLDRDDLLNLRSRDLINYLTSRHISTSGCVEKEDLVNILMRAVNNSSFHASSSTAGSSASSYPNSPQRNSFPSEQPNAKRKLSQSAEDVSSQDGIRITGSDANDSHQTVNEHEQSVAENIQEPTALASAIDVEYSDNSQDIIDITDEQQNEEHLIPNKTDVRFVENDDLANSASFNPGISDKDDSLPQVQPKKPLMLSDINSSADLEALSIKQLKELLMRNRTDFKGCIERAELLEKASRLWSDYTLSRKDLEKLSLDELCKICMDAPIECVFLDCGHMATCTSCGKQLCECPICRQFVVRCVRTFKV